MCPRCGADYAKAEQIRSQGRAVVAAVSQKTPTIEPAEEPVLDVMEGRVEDPRLELWFCIAAIPAALACGVLFHWATPGLQRTFFGMPVHETGHAVTAWFCGFTAIPTPLWRTITFSESRDFFAPLALAGALGFLVYKAYRKEDRALLGLAVGLLALQAIGTLFLKQRTANALITFGGDGGAMVLGTALMACFFFGKTTQLYRGSLRWGFVIIGAAAYVDAFSVWLAARKDYGAVPFGEQEASGLSDATRLVDWYSWDTDAMIRRYVALGVCCLVALAAVYAWGVWRALRSARERARSA